MTMSNYYSNTNANNTNTNTGSNYEEEDSAIVLSSQLPLQQEDVYAYTKNTATGTLLCWFSHGLSLLSALRSRFKKKNKKKKNPTTSDTTTSSHQHHHGHRHHGVAVAGFSALLWVTAATSLLGPMRDAAALSIGVSALPNLTLASTFLALGSSVPVGWLFEAPDPTLKRRLVFRRMGFTRGETQGTSLALFYRIFAAVLLCYGFLFLSINHVHKSANVVFFLVVHLMKLHSISLMWGVVGQALDFEEQAVKLHQRKADAIHTLNIQRGKQQLTTTNTSTSQQEGYHTDSSLDDDNCNNDSTQQSSGRSRARIGRLAFVGFGGTLGGIIGSFIASSTAHLLRISGLLFLSALILIFSANLSIELGTIMRRHWEEQQIVRNWEEFMHDTTISSSISNTSTTSSSIRPSVSLGCMKRLATIGNDLSRLGDTTTTTTTTSTSTKPIDDSIQQFVTSLGTMKRIASNNSLAQNQPLENQQFTTSSSSNTSSSTKNAAASMKRARSMTALKDSLSPQQQQQVSTTSNAEVAINENAFSQRLLRGVNTIVRSRLLMAIFTYNALYASTTVLLSFQRAELVANRKSYSPTSHKKQNQKSSSIMHAEADTAFLAKINAVSNIAVFALQACGLGALLAHKCGQRGTLVLMPLCRLCGVLLLLWWHVRGQGQPPDLTLFLILDELTRVINFAVAKPVREGLWRGLSNEARYEAKPIVDTLANRWGSGSAAFLVSLMDRILAFIAWGFAFWNTGERAARVGIIRDEGQQQQHHHHHHNAVDTLSKKSVFGFPPLLILCLIISAWWVMVSLHLGRTRSRIDIELKKHL